MTTKHLYLGLMTGTSVDGIDVALLEVDSSDTTAQPRIVGGAEYPIEGALRTELRGLATPGASEIDRLGWADHALGDALADAATRFLSKQKLTPEQIRAIGSHGQTIRHRPDSAHPFTLQIGDPNRIAYRTGIDTIADFRRADMAAGGQGAPLVPLFHNALFGADNPGVVLNIGGIANITVLPDRHGATELLGFDTGPGNALLDSWCEQHSGKPFDFGGAWARSGSISEPLLARLAADAFFDRPPPKSTGREAFTATWLNKHLGGFDLTAEDVQATLCELTAATAAGAIRRWAASSVRCIVAGGGRRNGYLMERLQHHLNIPVEPCESVAIDGDLLEAAAFAWLAHRHLERLPGAAKSTTGAHSEAVLGGFYPAG